MTATTYAREHLAHVDTTQFAETLTPERFRDVDYLELNGIDSITDFDDLLEWDFARFTEVN